MRAIEVVFLMVVSAFIAFILHITGIVPLASSAPWVAGFCCLVVFVALVLALDVLGQVRGILQARRLRKIESRFPGARATQLSNGGFLLTDRNTGATITTLLT